MMEEYTGILGNTRQRQVNATKSRDGNKKQVTALAFRIGVFATLLSVALIMAKAEISLFWMIVTSFALILTGKVLGESTTNNAFVWHWPKILKTIGWTVLFINLLSSGLGEWFQSKVQGADTWLSCSANSAQGKCADLRISQSHMNCTTQKELNRLRYIRNPYPLTICPGEGKLYVDGLSGKSLQFGLAPAFEKKYGHLFGGLTHKEVISSFMTINRPGSYPGSIANSWRIVPHENIPRFGQTSGFELYKIPYVELVVKPI